MDSSPMSPPSSPILIAEGLSKSYDKRQALKELSFSLAAGRVLGFLGPNGAGKTTAMRILTTILEPSAGHFTIDGVRSDYPDTIRRRIGVLPESLGFPQHVMALEYLLYFGQLYGLSLPAARRNAHRLLAEVGLERRAKSLIGSYSRGMRQRLGIARALVNDPVVLFLDEPTLGLDPRGQQELLTLVQRIAQQRGVGIIMCSHALSEIEVVCDDVVILSHGRVVAKGTVAEVLELARGTVTGSGGVRIRVSPPSIATAQGVLARVPGVTRVAAVDERGGWLLVELAAGAGGPAAAAPTYNHILEPLMSANISLQGFVANETSLQDVFLQVTEEHI